MENFILKAFFFSQQFLVSLVPLITRIVLYRRELKVSRTSPVTFFFDNDFPSDKRQEFRILYLRQSTCRSTIVHFKKSERCSNIA